MASSNLNSMELLDLLFDRQDGVLRNVELGPSGTNWLVPEDSHLLNAQENEDFINSILGPSDAVLDSPSWSPAASDSGISEDPNSDQLDSPPHYVPTGSPDTYSDGSSHSDLAYPPYQDSCQAMPAPKAPATESRETDVSIDFEFCLALNETQSGFTAPLTSEIPASTGECTKLTKDGEKWNIFGGG